MKKGEEEAEEVGDHVVYSQEEERTEEYMEVYEHRRLKAD